MMAGVDVLELPIDRFMNVVYESVLDEPGIWGDRQKNKRRLDETLLQAAIRVQPDATFKEQEQSVAALIAAIGGEMDLESAPKIGGEAPRE